MSNDPFSPDYQGTPPVDVPGRDKPQHPAAAAATESEPPMPTEEPPPMPSGGEPISTPAAALSEAAFPPPPPPPPPPTPPAPYPMRYDVEYPESLSRWKTLLRLPLLVPVWLFLYLVSAVVNSALTAGWATVFFRRRYPRWLFAASSGGLAFTARSWAYATLLTDQCPSFDRDKSPVTLEYDDPPDGHLSRWRVFFWKAALLIPHAVVLVFLGMAVSVVVLLSWFAILLTGRYPRGMFAFVTGANRWTFRVAGYFASFNDRYPPFAFSAGAGPASRGATITCGVIGWLFAGLYWLIIVAAIAASQDTDHVSVDYDRLSAGSDTTTSTYDALGFDRAFTLTLVRAHDPADDLAPILAAGPGQRLVAFEWTLRDRTDGSQTISGEGFRLQYAEGGQTHSVSEELLVIGGLVAPARVEGPATVTIQAIFVIPERARPVELRFKAPFTPDGGIKYTLE